jgi:hypothetical protein
MAARHACSSAHACAHIARGSVDLAWLRRAQREGQVHRRRSISCPWRGQREPTPLAPSPSHAAPLWGRVPSSTTRWRQGGRTWALTSKLSHQARWSARSDACTSSLTTFFR